MPIREKKLQEKIMKDPYNALVFKEGKGRVYLVGGFIRDLYMNARSPDRDYIVFGDVTSLVRRIRTFTGGTVIAFNDEQVVRIAMKGDVTLDFSCTQGSLQEDLAKRDFTMNAIAWSPEDGFRDFHNGIDDIGKRIIRSISRANFIADPLRMLRAYRFAAEIHGLIEKKTRTIIKILHNNIKQVSPERITLEFFKLLNSKSSAKYLRMAYSDKLLHMIFLFNKSMLSRSIRAVSQLEQGSITTVPSTIKVLLNKRFSQNLTYKGLLCLETLWAYLNSHYKSECLLAISNLIQKHIDLSLKGFNEFHGKKILAKEQLFEIFAKIREASIDSLIISNRLDLLPEFRRFQRIMNSSLLSSEEIINAAGLDAGPQRQEMIYAIKKAQFTGNVRSKCNAHLLIKRMITIGPNGIGKMN